MSKITQLSPDWKQWLVTNIQRGVPHQMLIDDMVNNNFDPVFASSSVKQLDNDLSPLTNTESIPKECAIPSLKTNLAQSSFESYDSDFKYDPSRIRKKNYFDIDGHRIQIIGRIDKPDIVVFQNVLTDEECDQLIEVSRPKLKQSKGVDYETGAEELSDLRTSFGTFFAREENAFIARIERRLALLMDVPLSNGEGIQILKYGVGAEYHPHYDYFLPESPGSAKHLKNGGQRICTLIMYLNDVEKGGETIFPEIGFSCIPYKGCAVYFSYHNTLGQLDRLTLHGGTPVRQGEKWIATKWVRKNKYGHSKT